MGILGRILFLLTLPWILFKSFKVIRSIRPDICFGTGAYASAIPLRVAELMGIPVVVHESNATPGLTNRWLGRHARKVFLNFSETARHFSGTPSEVVGMPVRMRTQVVNGKSVTFPSTNNLRVVLLGGSQGSRPLNLFVQRNLQKLFASENLTLIHQTGEKHFEAIKNLHSQQTQTVQQNWLPMPFIDSMEEAYRWAQLFLCRSGSSTLAELLKFRMPSILVPFPFATDDHQRANAQSFVDRGLGLMIPEDQLDSRFFGVLENLRTAPTQLDRMRASLDREARALEVKGSAAARIAAALLET